MLVFYAVFIILACFTNHLFCALTSLSKSLCIVCIFSGLMLKNFPPIYSVNLVNTAGFLGIVLDDTLSQQPHIDNLSMKLDKVNYLIINLPKMFPLSIVSSVYYNNVHWYSTLYNIWCYSLGRLTIEFMFLKCRKELQVRQNTVKPADQFLRPLTSCLLSIYIHISVAFIYQIQS